MKEKKEIYHGFIHKRIRRIMLVFILVCLILFSIVLFDSFKHNLPFYYILFFIPGFALSLFFKKTQKIFWSEEEQQIIKKMDFIGIILIITLILIRKIIFPLILKGINIIYVTDAILLITTGIFLGRVIFMWKKIKKIFFDKNLLKIKDSDAKK